MLANIGREPRHHRRSTPRSVGELHCRRHLVHARQGKPYAPVRSGFVFGWRAKVALLQIPQFLQKMYGVL